MLAAPRSLIDAETSAYMTPEDFAFFQEYVLRESGIVISNEKEYLIRTRLIQILQTHELVNLHALAAIVRKDPRGALGMLVVDALTTNETYFFRDQTPYELLRHQVLPQLMAARSDTRTLTFWCAASSSGQEPYSVAMLLREHFPQLAGWNVQFIATDLSSEMLEKARSGSYSQLEVNRGLPISYLIKYFQQEGARWVIKPEVRKMIDFRPLNLVQAWPTLPAADIVFIRNVLIYFDVQTKQAILGRIKHLLRPDGYLFLGCSETTVTLDQDFVPESGQGTVCYRRRSLS